MGFLTILAPYIPKIITLVNGAIKGKDKGQDKMSAAANLVDILARSIDPNMKIEGSTITAAIQAIFDQMKLSGEVDGSKEPNSSDKYYLVRASKVVEL